MTALAVGFASTLLAVVLVAMRTLRPGAPVVSAGDGDAGLARATRGQSAVYSAAAVCGEHVSAATFVGFTALVFVDGMHTVWLAVAAGGGYLLFVALVLQPLKRCRVYSLSDFVQWRLDSRPARRVVTACVVLVCCTYLLAQFKLVSEVVTAFTDWPRWVGLAALVVIGTAQVLAGPVGSSTGFHAVQFWIKLAGFAIPALVLVALWGMHGAPPPPPGPGALQWQSLAPPADELTTVYALCTVVALGVLGFPQFVTRFYSGAEPRTVSSTAVLVFGLTALLALLPLIYALLARTYLPAGASVAADREAATLVTFLVPELVAPGWIGTLLGGVLIAGAASATLAVTVALVATAGSYISQCVMGGGATLFRLGAVLTIGVPLVLSTTTPLLASVDLLGLLIAAFNISAATLAPTLLLGVWWRGLTSVGTVTGIIVGLVTTVGCTLAAVFGASMTVAGLDLASHPALLAVPTAGAAMVAASLLSRRRLPPSVDDVMARMHPAAAEGPRRAVPSSHGA